MGCVTLLVILKQDSQELLWCSFHFCIDEKIQESPLPTFLKFVRAIAAYQPPMNKANDRNFYVNILNENNLTNLWKATGKYDIPPFILISIPQRGGWNKAGLLYKWDFIDS